MALAPPSAARGLTTPGIELLPRRRGGGKKCKRINGLLSTVPTPGCWKFFGWAIFGCSGCLAGAGHVGPNGAVSQARLELRVVQAW